MASLRRRTGRDRTAGVAVEAPLRLLDVLRDGPAPLDGEGPARAAADRLRIAVVLSAADADGHEDVAELVRALEARGHQLALFVLDDDTPASGFETRFGPFAAPVLVGLAEWRGADVAVATSWRTVPDVLALSGVAARARLVQDHEPELLPASAERLWAEWSLRQDLHCLCASPWLAEVLTGRYGASATAFDPGLDHATHHALPTHRRDDLVLFHARTDRPGGAAGLGILALAELHRRRPEVELAVFGDAEAIDLPFPALQLGVLAPADRAHAHASATVGLCLSLTAPGPVTLEMLACGLPVVDVASDAMVATFGAGGPVTLAEADPLALCDAIEGLLHDLLVRATRSRDGAELVAARTWACAAEHVERGLRAALDAAVCD